MLTVYQDAFTLSVYDHKQALKKAKILVFWEKHGLDATIEAFDTKRRTLFDWKKKWIAGGKKIGKRLMRNQRCQRQAQTTLDEDILSEIKRLRWEHPNLGKEKIYPLLVRFCKERICSARNRRPLVD